MTTLNVFDATYSWSGRYGAYQTISCVIVANTKEEALGMALSQYPDTQAKEWEVEEIDMSAPIVREISTANS